MNDSIVFGHGLKTTNLDGKDHVSVDTADSLRADKTLPISGVGVQSIVNDVEAILKSI